MTATEKRLQDVARRRTEMEHIVKEGLQLIIERGILSHGNKGKVWCQCQGGRTEGAADILCQWITDDEGDLAVDRLVTLIIH